MYARKKLLFAFLSKIKRPAHAQVKKSAGREWFDAVVFATIAATLMRTFCMEAYAIPTGSMKNSLLVGDYLFVSKFSYGARLPMTPIAFPFAHDTLPVLNTKAYWDGIQLPYKRLPGLGKVERMDAVVFNLPADTIDHRPVDKKENYIKRCVGLPGETLEVVNAQVMVNHLPLPVPDESQLSYHVTTDGSTLNVTTMDKLGIEGAEYPYADGSYVLYLTRENLEKVRQFANIKKIERIIHPAGKMYDYPRIFPGDALHPWNEDNFGPVLIPKRGLSIALNAGNINIYRRAIQVYEHNRLEEQDGKIFINGKPAKQYTFQMDYFWMMGDNRHNSLDSRFWGFVPEDHLVGKAMFVWMSINDRPADLLHKIRWDRILTAVR